MISYAADSFGLYGELYHWPASTHREGEMLKVYEWDTGKYLGEIHQVRQTYNVIGNINEYQVAIGETTFGGREELIDTTAIIDYGSLIYIALQRSRTAREAIKVMTDLVAQYGYYSSGESFSIADPNEVWIMEMIGKGPGNKGAVWVAVASRRLRLSDANQARIQHFRSTILKTVFTLPMSSLSLAKKVISTVTTAISVFHVHTHHSISAHNDFAKRACGRFSIM